jgi:hypothetical protein
MIKMITDRIQAEYVVVAHSRPDKIGTPRLLSHYFLYRLSDYRQKKYAPTTYSACD